MDDDVKTLLAILALVYGSSNGLGLLKTALDPVTENLKALNEAIDDTRADISYKKSRAETLFKSLWSPAVIVYIILVLILPLFLALILRRGPAQALASIGLGSDTVASKPRVMTFYWIILVLSLIASFHHLSAYLKGCRGLIKFWEKEQKGG